MSLPNLIVIGAMKCGTTSLHDYLKAHPEIFMSQVKEIDFFLKERQWDKGVPWYESQFDSPLPWRGESSQNYTKRHHFEPGVAERIAGMLPEARLIYIVRDPVVRIVSHYHEALEGGYNPKQGMNAFLTHDPANNHYVRTSSYHYQLEAYLPFYALERIHILALEDLQENPLAAMNGIFRFLGVAEMDSEDAFRAPKNTRADKRSLTTLGRFVKSSDSRWIRALLPSRLKNRLRTDPRVSKGLLTQPIEPETLDDVVAERIREALAPDVAKFRKLTGMRFQMWSL